MKKRLASLLLAGALFHPLAQAAPAAGWDTALRSVDDAYWSAYNRCDLKVLSAMNTNDLEFFHDQGGVLHGKAEFDRAMAHNICGNPAVRVRREAVPGTVQAFPMMADGAVYGAVIEGRHRFYDVKAGTPDVTTIRPSQLSWQPKCKRRRSHWTYWRAGQGQDGPDRQGTRRRRGRGNRFSQIIASKDQPGSVLPIHHF